MGGLRLGLLKGSWALALAVLAGCGGRSSTLDPDAVAIEANQPTGGSTGDGDTSASGTAANGNVGATGSATSATGGKPGSSGSGTAGSSAGGGTAGSAPAGGAPSAGSPSSGGAAQGGAVGIGAATYNSCNNYCSSTVQGRCPSNFSTDECISSCVSELSGQTPQCRRTAGSLLDCLTTAYQNSESCSQFDELSGAKCSGFSAAYQRCVGTGPYTTPAPTPEPSPAQVCSSSGNSSDLTCDLSVKCNTGTYYLVSCYQTSSLQSSCTCSSGSPNGPSTGAGFSLNESVTFACYDSLAACGFPQIGAK